MSKQTDSKPGLEDGVIDTGFNFPPETPHTQKKKKKKDKINKTIVLKTLTEK